MTTQEMLDFVSAHGPVGDCHTVYRGPCQDRPTLRQAAAEGKLSFSVNRSHIGLSFGEQTMRGYYPTFDAAVAALSPGWRLSAHYAGWGYAEECLLYCSHWKPVGELLRAHEIWAKPAMAGLGNQSLLSHWKGYLKWPRKRTP